MRGSDIVTPSMVGPFLFGGLQYILDVSEVIHVAHSYCLKGWIVHVTSGFDLYHWLISDQDLSLFHIMELLKL